MLNILKENARKFEVDLDRRDKGIQQQLRDFQTQILIKRMERLEIKQSQSSQPSVASSFQFLSQKEEDSLLQLLEDFDSEEEEALQLPVIGGSKKKGIETIGTYQ